MARTKSALGSNSNDNSNTLAYYGGSSNPFKSEQRREVDNLKPSDAHGAQHSSSTGTTKGMHRLTSRRGCSPLTTAQASGKNNSHTLRNYETAYHVVTTRGITSPKLPPPLDCWYSILSPTSSACPQKQAATEKDDAVSHATARHCPASTTTRYWVLMTIDSTIPVYRYQHRNKIAAGKQNTTPDIRYKFPIKEWSFVSRRAVVLSDGAVRSCASTTYGMASSPPPLLW